MSQSHSRNPFKVSPFQAQAAHIEAHSQPRALLNMFQSSSANGGIIGNKPLFGSKAQGVESSSVTLQVASEDIGAKIERTIDVGLESVDESPEETGGGAVEASKVSEEGLCFDDSADFGPFAAFSLEFSACDPLSAPLVLGSLPLLPRPSYA